MAEVQPVASTSRAQITERAAHTMSPEQTVPSTNPQAASEDTGGRTPEASQHQRPETPMPMPENPEWGLKEIIWPPEPWEGMPQYRVRIVTQNANGPCSFIAICKSVLLPVKQSISVIETV